MLRAAGIVPGTTRRRRFPARRRRSTRGRIRAGLVRRQGSTLRPEPAQPRTRARLPGPRPHTHCGTGGVIESDRSLP
ncbi:hypothetical protein GCM10010191_61350 [Actinomadura vinacea]|uniref:Uncharacterized protein n=1 Tax=Actinomadura vinacea TaxID=115336 RepID=A0ABP5WWP4_9ACTN